MQFIHKEKSPLPSTGNVYIIDGDAYLAVQLGDGVTTPANYAMVGLGGKSMYGHPANTWADWANSFECSITFDRVYTKDKYFLTVKSKED